MVMIPENPNTTKNQIESRKILKKPRPYLGMSGIGHECIRHIWLGWRWASNVFITAKQQRIFDRGDLEEDRVVKDLQELGISVYGRQREIIGFAGHAKGHIDGIALGIIEAPETEHLLEFKTMNDKYFNIFLDKGLDAFPNYFAQMQRYMGGLKLKRAFFSATNKNDESRDYVRVYFDKQIYEDLCDKERNVVMSELPPQVAFPSTYYKCKWCAHYNICHNGMAPVINCRTCKHMDLCDNGKWECGVTHKELTEEQQRKGCDSYKRLF